jgi:hypothetical protein
MASDILFSQNIRSEYVHIIEHDLDLLETFEFKNLKFFKGISASLWLNERVHYIVQENILSSFNQNIFKTIFTEQQNVDYPNANIIPYSQNSVSHQNESLITSASTDSHNGSVTLMSNLGTTIYLTGKSERQLYTMRISKGFLKKPEEVRIISPRVGIVSLGEGLFDPEIMVNSKGPLDLANSVLRLGTLFHEARHSDGNGQSLGFVHSICPVNHDYEGLPACDENLNGPYTIGSVMISEMTKACEDCSETDKQLLKLIILDNLGRIIKTTHKFEAATNWDPTPEKLDSF